MIIITESDRLLVSETLVYNVKKFEGLRLEAYRDTGGTWTVGYGHTRGVKPGMTVTREEAEVLLREDLREAQRQVLSLGVCRTQGELDALTDFVFNVGFQRLQKSTLLRLIENLMPQELIVKEFRRWSYVNGVRLKGLAARRRWDSVRWCQTSLTLQELEEELADEAKGGVS